MPIVMFPPVEVRVAGEAVTGKFRVRVVPLGSKLMERALSAELAPRFRDAVARDRLPVLLMETSLAMLMLFPVKLAVGDLKVVEALRLIEPPALREVVEEEPAVNVFEPLRVRLVAGAIVTPELAPTVKVLFPVR